MVKKRLSMVALSKMVGLKPKSLGVMLSDDTVSKFRFNYRGLVNAMHVLGLTPNEILLEE